MSDKFNTEEMLREDFKRSIASGKLKGTKVVDKGLKIMNGEKFVDWRKNK